MSFQHPLLDAHEIAPRLWQGSAPLPGKVLRVAGFDVLVLCARELVKQQTPDLFPGVRLIHAPNDDGHNYPLTRQDLRVAIEAANEVVLELQAGKQVLVTCAAGLNRSGLVSALVLNKLYGWSGDECIERVRERRDHSEVFPNVLALSNPKFVRALQQLKGSIA